MTTSRGPFGRVPDRMREAAGDPLKIGKNPVATLVPQPGEGIHKKRVVIHYSVSTGQHAAKRFN